MPYQFPEIEHDSGWINLTDMKKGGFIITVKAGFLEDDDDNQFKGEVKPRFIVKGTIEDDEVKIGVPKGYSRDEKLADLAEYLEQNPEETVDMKVVKPGSSAYLDFEVVA